VVNGSFKNRKTAALAATAIVGIIAGVVSFSHEYGLSVMLHQPVYDAWLIPWAVDGCVLCGSLTVFSGFRLGYAAVGFGVAVSVAANILSALPYGVLAALWAAIPSLSFILSVAVLERAVVAWSKTVDVTLPKPVVKVPSIRAIMDQHKVGYPRAKQIQEQLRTAV
jgi:hypothetical protein